MERVQLNISSVEFSAISRLRVAVLVYGVKTVDGGALVRMEVDDPCVDFPFRSRDLIALQKLKTENKTGNVALNLSWNEYCTLSNTITKLEKLPAKAKEFIFRLKDDEVNDFLKMYKNPA